MVAREFWLIVCALGIAAASPGIAGQSAPVRSQAPVKVLRDRNGSALVTFSGQMATANWSGYVIPEYLSGQSYTSAQGTWVVPTVEPLFVNTYSANWVGIGGFCTTQACKKVDRTLIQLGTEQDADSKSKTQYAAWYELLPKNPVAIPLEINPGDVITASLSCAGNCVGKQPWTLSMTDETTGDSWSKVVKYKSPLLSAEWIEEAPTQGNHILPLADFGVTTFSQTMVDGGSAELDPAIGVIMEDPHGQTSNVSAPGATQDDFNACFSPNSTLAACASP